MSSHAPSYHGYRFPPEIISHAVWLYYRFALSFRDVEDLLATAAGHYGHLRNHPSVVPDIRPGLRPHAPAAARSTGRHVACRRAVWLYYRFALSFRDVEDLLAQRGITVTYETIRQWCLTFGRDYARTLRRRHGQQGDTWHVDELFVTLQGRRQYLWRAVDEDGDFLDILVQSRRNRRAAVRSSES